MESSVELRHVGEEEIFCGVCSRKITGWYALAPIEQSSMTDRWCDRCRKSFLSLAQKKMTEVDNVQNPAVAWARKNGVRATKLQGMGNRAQPDYIFWILGGSPLLIEFKRPGEIPTPLQTHQIRAYLQDGYDVQVHDTRESAIAAISARTFRARGIE